MSLHVCSIGVSVACLERYRTGSGFWSRFFEALRILAGGNVLVHDDVAGLDPPGESRN